MQPAPDVQSQGVYRRSFGDIVVTAILDGGLPADFGMLAGISRDQEDRVLAKAFRSGKPVLSVSCFVVHTAGKVVLIDTGAGNNPSFDAGRLPAGLDAAGVPPDAIDLVLLTHLHGDHSGGLTTPEGRAAYPNAELMLHADERAFWLGMANPSAALKPHVEAARAAIAPYHDRMRTFTKGEVAPGIVAEPLPGHTPGHTGFRIGSGGDEVLMWGDIVHLPVLQARYPGASLSFDHDPVQAVAQRERLFDKVATDRILVAGSHLDFPCFAHLERSGDAFAVVPEAWRTGL